MVTVREIPQNSSSPVQSRVCEDDEVISSIALVKLPIFNHGEVVVTEKLDGGNSCFYGARCLPGPQTQEDGCTWLSWDRVKELADMLGIPTVPEVVRKQFSSVDELKSFIEARMKAPSCCGSANPEGFVIRTVESFSYDNLDKNVIKYVRKNHVQTSDDWRLTWKQAKLHRKF